MTEIRRSAERIEILVAGNLVYSDSIDHWENAFLRLMDLSDEQAVDFVTRVGELVGRSPDLPVLDALRHAWGEVVAPASALPDPRSPRWLDAAERPTRWETDRVRDSRVVGLATDRHRTHGWLADLGSGEAVTPEEVDYEVDYFEGGRADLGYGSYLAQSPWRMEKAERQCREVAALRRYRGLTDSNLRVLDVGSGYGYFMGAAQALGWGCDGIEISTHAAEVSFELVGTRPFVGTLEQFAGGHGTDFDVVVMWDFIEHVEDPTTTVRVAASLLGDSGSLFLRTPNLWAVEFEVFGADYHSLKREHVNMFSPESIARLLTAAGFARPLVLSEGHLLRGFAGIDVGVFAAVLRGSDLLVMASVAER